MKTRRYILPALVAIFAWSSIAAAQQADAARVDAGRAIALDRGKGNCLACHASVDSDVASSVGPELSVMRERFQKRADLVAIVTNEQSRNPQTVMPPFGANRILTPDEIEKIVDYLYSL